MQIKLWSGDAHVIQRKVHHMNAINGTIVISAISPETIWTTN
jgi:hypothetical protein